MESNRCSVYGDGPGTPTSPTAKSPFLGEGRTRRVTVGESENPQRSVAEDNVRPKERKRLLRIPFVVPLITITVLISVVAIAIIGFMTFRGADQTVDEITETLQDITMDRVYDSVTSLVQQCSAALTILGRAQPILRLFQKLESNVTNSLWNDVTVVSQLYTVLSTYDFLTMTGLEIYRDESIILATQKMLMLQDGSTYNNVTNVTEFGIRYVTGVNSYREMQFGPLYSFHRHTWQSSKLPSYPDGNSTTVWSNYYVGLNEIYYPIKWPIWANLPFGRADPNVPPFGSVTTALSVTSLQSILGKVYVSPNAVVALWEPSANSSIYFHMIAASTPNISISIHAGDRYSALDCPNKLLSQVARRLQLIYPNSTAFPNEMWTTFNDLPDGDGTILVSARWISNIVDPNGLKWLVVAVIPKNDFLKTMQQTRKRVVGAVAGTTAAMAVFAIILAYLLVYPIKKLSETMIQATDFDFSAIRDGYLTKRSIFEPLEIAQCKEVFNIMLTRFAKAIQTNKSLQATRAPALISALVSATSPQAKTQNKRLSEVSVQSWTSEEGRG
ncbi:hypothetical protein SpCBS45565_g05474 [Spizellomyces sp. 'palustris']|nr:hypothetical protein SpCBS45565_g05474 [Spizellomyces sp. 'palustris']